MVAFHVWPDAVPGGFVGVDVFLVISGALITSGLLRELERTGTLSLPGFWARRARRLLPAGLLVLTVTTAALMALIPLDRWEPMLAELRASVLYVQNWQLASSAVDYFAANDAPSPVRHFWSLSVEEQFYLAWPPILLGVAALTRRGRPVARRRGMLAAIALATGASLAYALLRTNQDPTAAYFSTPARAWEFGAGALLVALPAAGRTPVVVRALAAWGGLAAIAVAALAYDESTPFPGTAALLPVLGAVAVLWAGMPARPWAPSRGYALHPVQRLGDLSYAVYLWHWPLLILAPYLLDRRPGTLALVCVVALTVGLAWLTERLVETPVRRGALARRRARWTFLAAAGGMAATLGLIAVAAHHLDATRSAAADRTRATLAAAPECLGAAARDPERPCRNPRLRTAVIPAPVEARSTGNAPCDLRERSSRLRVCAFGADTGDPGTLALIGDSHAAHWRATLDATADAKRWRGVSLTYTGCPLSTATRKLREPDLGLCTQFKAEVFGWLRRHPEVRTVVVAALAGGTGVRTRAGQDPFETAVRGYIEAWRRLPASVRRIVVLRDNPKEGKGTLECIQRAIDAGRPAGPACALPRREVLDRDPAVEAARRVGAPRVQVADLTERFCDRSRCFGVIGGVLVHRDQDHLTPVFARTLGPALQRALDRLPHPVAPTD